MITIIYSGLSLVSVLIIIFVLMQERGSGLGRAFGGSDSFYRSRRGIEKFLFKATVACGFLFILLSLINTAFF